MIKRLMQVVVLLSLLPLSFASFAQIERYVAGTHYTELRNPVNTADASKVEVVEAFWYGCSHCFRFEPLIVAWEHALTDDVDFQRFPALWNPLMKIHAQIYYTLDALDAVEELHETVYNAINLQGNRMHNEKVIGDLLVDHGLDREAFESAFNSFSVRTKVNQAEKRMQDYEIRSTPNMIVNGKYLVTTGASVPTQQDMLNVVDFLVERERQSLGSTGD